MKVTLLAESGLKKEFSVLVSEEDVSSAINKQIAEIRKDVKIKGFRPGKVPETLIKQRHMSNIMQDVLTELIQKTSAQLLKDHNLTPALQPKVELVKFAEHSPLEYKFLLEVLPEINIPNFTEITLERIICDISAEDVDQDLARLAESRKKLVSSNKEHAELGDTLLIDYSGKIDGVVFAGGTAQGQNLALGSKSFIDNFEEQLVGSKIGDEKIVKVTFPTEYHAPDLAGKEAEFTVKVHDILQSTIPEISVELANEFGFEDLDALKLRIKELMIEKSWQASKEKLKKELFDQLEKMCTYDLPETMVEEELNSIWQRVEESKKQYENFSEGKTDEELKATYHKIAKRRVSLGLLIARISFLENIIADSASINEAVFKEARNFPGQENLVLDYYRKNPQIVEKLKTTIVEEKTVDFILSKINYHDKKIPLSEFSAAVTINGEDY